MSVSALDLSTRQLEEVSLVSLAPAAGFLLVSEMDGPASPQALVAFLDALDSVEDPVLRDLIDAGPPVEVQLQTLREDPSQIRPAITAAGAHFFPLDGGEDARAAYLRLLHAVANAHGYVRTQDRRALDEVAKVLDGHDGHAPWAGLAVLTAFVLAACCIVASGSAWWLGLLFPIPVVIAFFARLHMQWGHR